jgi:hypothetical protein
LICSVLRCFIAPFDLPDMKIARARKHIQELEMELATYFNVKPLRLVVELNPFNDQTRHQSHAWVPRVSAEPGPILATIIGDVFHNLRAALDILACDLVRIAQKSPKNVYFPFADSADAMPKRIKDKNLDRAGEEVVKIVTELKPYPSGDKFLRAIHDMDILDKHQALVPVVAGGASPQATIAFGPQPTNLMPIKTIIKDGRPLWIMPPVSNLPLGTELAAEWGLYAIGPFGLS